MVREELALPTANAAKVDKLVAELPRSGERFLERFIKCLQESAEEEPGTSHEQIADVLQEELRCRNSPGIMLAISKSVCRELLASYPGPHTERGSEPSDTWQNSRMC